ncbi:hypothetical protein [Nocardioides pocheonensis]|jgi:hypothetical protein|uniref:Aromatic ring-opening dioxygenase LigA n=1 Tax=Nocardioides pocheonensis TaxID=661485 RepID=A0A3N0GNA9_9ACTN|nr:hypothetical protein [Nocardioides pocheonensis]RNM13964.1 hypothetical protein EFL26_13525 [Nocardioides pocheonensis]
MRATLDKLISWTGLLLAVVLLVAGGLLTWASSFAGNQVHDQLAMQDITMPAKAQLETKAQHAALDQYAGQKMTTGAQAKAFSDHYILVHMNAAGGGKTYEEVSGQYIQMTDAQKASPEGQKLAGLRQTLFMGNTLRGELLTAYAFGKLGAIAGYAAIASFLGAGLMLILGLFGLAHAKRARESAAVAAAKVGTPITA